MKIENFTLRYGKTLLHFGPGSASALEDWLRRVERIYVLTGKSAARVSGALRDVAHYLTRSSIKYEVFDGVHANPPASTADIAAEKIWRFGAEAVIAIGGGSVIDIAKIASVIAACGGRASEYLRREREVCGALMIAAINLTHGTGSEMNRIAVATIDETREKVSIASHHMYPSIAVDDPRYLTTLSKNQTIYTAFDAFYHALEAASSRMTSPFTRALCEASARLVVRWLPVAVKKPDNLEARYWLLYASALSGIAVDNSRTHIAHGIEHVLSGLEPSLAHGSGLAALGPAVIKVLYSVVPEILYEILKYLDPSLSPNPEDAEKATEAVWKFQVGVGFSESLLDYGFAADMADKVAELALKSTKYLLELAPVEVDRDLVRRIFLESLARFQK